MSRFLFLFIVICFCANITAQDALRINEKLSAYTVNALQEKAFLHLDKTSYISGEILWFKFYNVDASLHKPFDLNKVAYVEVINNKNLPVLQSKISLHNGLGNGSFMLPTSLPTGSYTIRGYTNWMKNFPSDYFFEKAIVIVNALKLPDSSINKVSDQPTVRYFPEGGQIVAGIRSKVAFRMAGIDDSGIDCSGVILNNNNDTIVSFQSLKFGIGSFYFTPADGIVYKSIVKSRIGEHVVTQDLPVVQEKGFVLSVEQAVPERLTVKVQAKGEQEGSVSLLVHTRQITKIFSTVALHNGTADFTVNTNLLPEGISHFTVFRYGVPVCERLYFKRPTELVRARVSTNAKEYKERNKVELTVVTEDKNVPRSANMSVAVFRTDSLQESGIDDFQTYLLLTGDLRGRIDSAQYYFSDEGEVSKEALDNVMLSHGWSRFRWDEVLRDQAGALPYVHEQVGHIITGKITNAGTGEPLSERIVYFGTPSRYVKLNGATSNNRGEFSLIPRDFFGYNEIIVQAISEAGTAYRLDIHSPFSEKPVSRKYPFSPLPPSIEASLQSGSIGMQVQQLFYDKENKKFLLPETDTSSFYGTPDNSFLLDDYTRFTTIEEVLREYVPQVNVRKQNGKFRLQMYDANTKVLIYDPLILLDGVPMFDVDRFMTMDPLKIWKLDVIPNTYFLGAIRAEGIASFISYNGDMAEFEPDPGALVVDYEGLQLNREFYSPDYATPEMLYSRLPDFRNVLYWQPDLNADEKGKAVATFYTSNQPGKYRIVIHGITKDGKPFTGVNSFQVNPSR